VLSLAQNVWKAAADVTMHRPANDVGISTIMTTRDQRVWPVMSGATNVRGMASTSVRVASPGTIWRGMVAVTTAQPKTALSATAMEQTSATFASQATPKVPRPTPVSTVRQTAQHVRHISTYTRETATSARISVPAVMELDRICALAVRLGMGCPVGHVSHVLQRVPTVWFQ
jgi:hypothetical protein